MNQFQIGDKGSRHIVCAFIFRLGTIIVDVSRILEDIMSGLLENQWLYLENVAITIRSPSEETLKSSSISELSNASCERRSSLIWFWSNCSSVKLSPTQLLDGCYPCRYWAEAERVFVPESLVKLGAVLPVLENKAFFQFKLVCVSWVEDRNELGEASAIHLGLLPRQRNYTSSGCAFGFGSAKASGCEVDKNPRS